MYARTPRKNLQRGRFPRLTYELATKTRGAHPIQDGIPRSHKMQSGVDSFAAAISDPVTGLTLTPVDRVQHLLEEIKLADQVGLDVFGIGEHHRAEFLDSAPVVILAAAAAQTQNIRPTSAVTVL